MVDYMQQLKNILINDIDESNQYDGQLRLRKEVTLSRINNIREMMIENSNQKNEREFCRTSIYRHDATHVTSLRN